MNQIRKLSSIEMDEKINYLESLRDNPDCNPEIIDKINNKIAAYEKFSLSEIFLKLLAFSIVGTFLIILATLFTFGFALSFIPFIVSYIVPLYSYWVVYGSQPKEVQQIMKNMHTEIMEVIANPIAIIKFSLQQS